MRKRIEAIKGWDKEEVRGDYEIVVHEDAEGKGGIAIFEGLEEYIWGKEPRTPIMDWLYLDSCEKLYAFKKALLWLAEKNGKLGPEEGDECEVEVDGKKWIAKLVRKQK